MKDEYEQNDFLFDALYTFDFKLPIIQKKLVFDYFDQLTFVRKGRVTNEHIWLLFELDISHSFFEGFTLLRVY